MNDDAYYQSDLAWVHHCGYAHYAENTWSGIAARLRAAGIAPGRQVLDVGCGSGLLARRLVEVGFCAHGIDASPAMIALARAYTPAATFEVARLPDAALPPADAVVSTGHVLNYLDTQAEIARALSVLASTVRAGGLLVVDLMTERFAQTRNLGETHAKVEADWTIVTRFSRPQPNRFDRHITVFRRDGECWRRSDEHHRNVTFETDAALRILREHGVDAQPYPAFGTETLPDGLVVLAGIRC